MTSLPLERMLIQDIASELSERSPDYLRRYPILLPDDGDIRALLSDCGFEVAHEALLATIGDGIEELRRLGIPILAARGGADAVGLLVARSLIDVALAASGSINLRPEPRDNRVLADLFDQEFDSFCLASGQEVRVAKRAGRPTVVISALGVPLTPWRSLAADSISQIKPIFVETRCGGLLTGGMNSAASYTDHADDVIEAIEISGQTKVDLIGWCNGGRIAVDVAARRPESVSSVTLIAATLRSNADVVGGTCRYEDNLERAFAKVRSNGQFADPIAKMMRQAYGAVEWTSLPDSAARAQTFLGSPRLSLSLDLGRPMHDGAALRAYAARTERDEAIDVKERLQRLECAVAVVAGTDDPIVSNRHTLQALNGVRRAPTISIMGAGHCIPDLQYRYLRMALEGIGAERNLGASALRCGRLSIDVAADCPEWIPEADVGFLPRKRVPLADLFRYPALQWPRRDAISDGVRTMTFVELELSAQNLGKVLAQHGLQADDHVLVLAQRGAVAPVLAAAIWKAGGVYVPIDPDVPASRIQDLLEQVRPAAILGSRSEIDRLLAKNQLLGSIALVAFDDEFEMQGPRAEYLAAHGAVPKDEANAAYIIFTSGSTGSPKGVVISHGSLIDYFSAHNDVLQFGPKSRVLALSPPYFDVSVEDTLLPLSLGSFVRSVRGSPLGPILRRILREERITHLIAVSTVLGLITGDGRAVSARNFPDLTMVMTGAEACDPRLIDLWVLALPTARVINAYGPTEATIVCLTYTVEDVERERTTSYPIGFPLKGVDALILDDNGTEISKEGHQGELAIGGTQVMLGYLGRPAESHSVLFERGGKRFYRTGDICSFDDRGRVQHHGRRDDMVKIGGRRLDLGEIRSCLLSQREIAGVGCGLLSVGDRKVVGVVAVLDLAVPEICNLLRDRLAAMLPSAIMPAVIGITRFHNMTPSGKTDERALMRRLEWHVKAWGLRDGVIEEPTEEQRLERINPNG